MERQRAHKYFDDIIGYERIEEILSAPRNIRTEREIEVERLLDVVYTDMAAALSERHNIEENTVQFEEEEEEEFLEIDFELDRLVQELTSRR